MDIKKTFQYGLLILLILASFLFYYKYFKEDVKIIKKDELEILKTKKKLKFIKK